MGEEAKVVQQPQLTKEQRIQLAYNNMTTLINREVMLGVSEILRIKEEK